MNRTEKRKKETRRKIIESTMLLIKENGYNETTMEAIAKKTDIAKGTLYNYYSIKEEIISDFIRVSFEDKNSKRIESLRKHRNTEERLLYIFRNLMEGINRQKDLFEKYIIYQMQLLVSFGKKKDKSGIGELSLEVIRLGKEAGEISEELPVSLVSELIMFAFIETVKDYYVNEREKIDEKVLNRHIQIVLKGIQP